jgi:hypothetical protein
MEWGFMSSKIRALLFVMGCVALLVALYAYADFVYMLGFPDGHIAERDRVLRVLAYGVIAVSVAMGLWCLQAAWRQQMRYFYKAVMGYGVFLGLVMMCHFSL